MNWLQKTAQQLSRSHMVELLRWVMSLEQNMAFQTRPGDLDNWPQDAATDLDRVRRIFSWGSKQAHSITQPYGNDLSRQIPTGAFDQLLPNTYEQIKQLVASLDANFNQVQLDTSVYLKNFDTLKQIADPAGGDPGRRGSNGDGK